jgi:CO/xanthine dehydrogenase FAD-binding subunit
MSLWNTYHTPHTVGEALHLLQQYGDRAQIVAGGTDLILDMQHGNRPPLEALVDVTRIAGLDDVRQEDGWVVIGAAVTHAQIEGSALIREHGAALVESCRAVGGPQVRHVATLGGNVAHALPAADGAIGLLALEAQAQVCTLAGDEVTCAWQPLLTLYGGPGQNTLERNQMIRAFRFPLSTARQASAFDRIMRPQGVALPILGVAAKLTLDEDRPRVSDAAIAIGPAGPIPFRATDAEAALVAAGVFDDDALEAAVAAAQAQARLRTSKYRASKEYRHEMVAVLLRRVLRRANQQLTDRIKP